MVRRPEHNKKISEGMKRYFQNETEEHREMRRNNVKRAKEIQSKLYKRYKLINELVENIKV